MFQLEGIQSIKQQQHSKMGKSLLFQFGLVISQSHAESTTETETEKKRRGRRRHCTRTTNKRCGGLVGGRSRRARVERGVTDFDLL